MSLRDCPLFLQPGILVSLEPPASSPVPIQGGWVGPWSTGMGMEKQVVSNSAKLLRPTVEDSAAGLPVGLEALMQLEPPALLERGEEVPRQEAAPRA